MMAKITPPELSFGKTPPAGYHFMVVFFVAGILPNPLDIRFKKVSLDEAHAIGEMKQTALEKCQS